MKLSIIVARYKFFLFLSLSFAVLFTSFSPFFKIVNNVDYFNLENDQEKLFYDKTKKIFGNDEFFVISFEKDNIFTEKNLKLIKNITKDLQSSELIRKVISLSNAENINGENNFFYISPFLESIPKTQKEIKKIQRRALNNPFFKDTLISSDSSTTAIVVFTYENKEEDYRKNLIEETKEILKKYSNTRFHYAGWTITNFSLSQYMQKDLIKFIPVTYILIAIVTFFLFRNIHITILTMIIVTCSLGSTVGLFTILGYTLNNVTIIVIPLIMALALSDVVHIFNNLNKYSFTVSKNRKDILLQVINKVSLPCLLTSLTTAVGFISLYVSDLEPIRQFSVLSSAGILFKFFYAFFLLPPLILISNPELISFDEQKSKLINDILHKLSLLVSEKFKIITFIFSTIIVLSIILSTQIKSETNFYDFFRKNSQIQEDLRFVENKLSGVGSLSLVAESDIVDAFKYPENLKIIEEIQNHLISYLEIDKVTSFNDFLKEMNKSFHNEDDNYYKIPESKKQVSQFLLLYDSKDINEFITEDYNKTRIMVRLNEHSSKVNEKLINKVRDYIDSLSLQNIDIKVTGQALHEVNTISAIVNGQVKSLSLAIIIISLLMFLCFKSFAISLLSIIPNIFPILLNFAIMAAFNIPLNTATSLISAVALGIAVDDTIHFLTHYQEKRKKGETIENSVAMAIKEKGLALISSSIILCVGFGALTLSHFMPVFYFGLLSAIIMITALVGDLLFLPSILLLKTLRRT